MTAHFRFVAHAAKRDASEFATESTRNGAAKRSLTGAGRPDKTQDRPLQVLLQAQDRDVFNDAIFHLFEAVVIFVEKRASCPNVESIFR